METAILFIILVTLGYLSGSICSAIIISRLFSLPDPRSEGSGNPGATNVLRLAGKKYAALVLLGDMFKGLFPVLIAKLFPVSATIVGFTAFAAVIGHMYPVFFNFKGGKGVATALGTLLGLNFLMGFAVLVIWLLIANFLKYSSLASLVAIILAPLISILVLRNLDIFLPLFMITVLIIYKHRNNITRLIDGEEPKIKFRRHQLTDLTDDLLNQEDSEENSTSNQQQPPSDSSTKK